MALDLRTSEIEHQFIQDRINFVECLMSELCLQFSSYNRKIADQRDSGDRLSKIILKLASKEVLNPTLRSALGRFADILHAIQDYREAEVQRIDHRVILEFSAYDEICKQAKVQLKKSFATRARELTKRNQLEKVRGKKPTNWQQIYEAEREADKARTDAALATNHLSQEIDSFEKKKLDDLRRIILDFIQIELLFHTKALELYTKAYQVIDDIKPDGDLKEFRNRFTFASHSQEAAREMAGDASRAPTAARESASLSLFETAGPRLPEHCSSSSGSSDESNVSESTANSRKSVGLLHRLLRAKKSVF